MLTSFSGVSTLLNACCVFAMVMTYSDTNFKWCSIDWTRSCFQQPMFLDPGACFNGSEDNEGATDVPEVGRSMRLTPNNLLAQVCSWSVFPPLSPSLSLSVSHCISPFIPSSRARYGKPNSGLADLLIIERNSYCSVNLTFNFIQTLLHFSFVCFHASCLHPDVYWQTSWCLPADERSTVVYSANSCMATRNLNVVTWQEWKFTVVPNAVVVVWNAPR